MSFAGLRVVSLESRRAHEIEAMIKRHGGNAFVAPSVKEQGIEDHKAATDLVDQLEQDRYDMLICMTATSLKFLREIIDGGFPPDRLRAAISRVTVISRGPKPLTVLRPQKIPVAITVPEPNTWREIVDAVRQRPERRIAVLEYGRSNLEMNAALEEMGAEVTPISLYRWILPDDIGPLREAARRIAQGQCDVILFTSSIQLDHLLQISREMGLADQVRRALIEDIVVTSVGPIMTDTLVAQGIEPQIIPTHPKMWAVVKAAAEQAPELIRQRHSRSRPAS